MKSDVRILLVGDGDVGKSSLITSLIREQFVEDVEDVVPEVTIPPEITTERVTTHIIDSSSRAEDEEQLQSEIRAADVICVVYSVAESDASLARIADHWLPYIRRVRGVGNDDDDTKLVPVILVGNKIDLREGDESTARNLEEAIMPMMVRFREVETCVECSAKTLLNLSEVFYFAQKAVLHPTAPLYDTRDHQLRPACVDALKRVFKLCDKDRDNLLSDTELNDFQRKCFNAPLQQHELEGVKDVVRSQVPDGVVDNALTEEGFLFLHKLFIQRGRLETTWTVLRKFGYGDDLQLRPDYVNPPLNIQPDQTVELSPQGYDFLTGLFKSFDRDCDSALSPDELANLFATVPQFSWPKDFAEGVATNSNGWVTLMGFLAQWTLSFLQEPTKSLGYLACLDYPFEDITSAVKITRSKRVDLKKRRTTRNVFRCYVFGATGCGKSAALRAHVGKSNKKVVYQPTTKITTAINDIFVRGVQKYLVLHEIPANGKDLDIIKAKKRLENECDVAAFFYDASDPNSFEYVANLQAAMGDVQVPVMFVATKTDLPEVEQDFEMQPEDYSKLLDIQPPVAMSVANNDVSDALGALVATAMQPHLSMPAAEEDSGVDTATLVKYGVVVASVAAVGLFVLVRALRRQ